MRNIVKRKRAVHIEDALFFELLTRNSWLPHHLLAISAELGGNEYATCTVVPTPAQS